MLCYDTITKAARKLDKGDHTHSVQDACVRDIIQADDTTFVMASGTSLALVKFENKEYLKAPIKIINLIENDIYYEPIIKTESRAFISTSRARCYGLALSEEGC